MLGVVQLRQVTYAINVFQVLTGQNRMGEPLQKRRELLVGWARR